MVDFVTDRPGPIALALCVASSAIAAAAPSWSAPSGWDDGSRSPKPSTSNPDPHIVEIDLTARHRRGRGRTGREGEGLDLRRRPAGAADSRGSATGHRALHERLPRRRPSTGTACACRSRWTACRTSRSRRSSRGESFTYDFVVRDAGLFWYHPHVDVGGAGRLRPLRRAARRGSGRRRRRAPTS